MISDSNATDVNDAALVGLINASADRADIELKASGKYGLHVIADIADVPTTTLVHAREKFLNGTSEELNVNGSVTPVVFTVAPPSGQVWYLKNLVAYIDDNGTGTPDQFGNIATLTNGCLLQIERNSTTYNIVNLATNTGISSSFHEKTSDITDFISGNNTFFGAFPLSPSITLNGTLSDKIKMTIRDDLTGLNYFRLSTIIWRVI